MDEAPRRPSSGSDGRGAAHAGPGPAPPAVATRRAPRPSRRGLPQVLWRTVVKSWDDSIFGTVAPGRVLADPVAAAAAAGAARPHRLCGGWFGPDTIERDPRRRSSRSAASVFTRQRGRPDHRAHRRRRAPRGPGRDRVGRLHPVAVGRLVGDVDLRRLDRARRTTSTTVRNPVWQRLFALLLYVMFLVIAVFVLPLVALGPTLIVNVHAGVLASGGGPADRLRLPAAVALMLMVGLTTLYKQALHTPLPWYRHLPGGALAALIFLVAVHGPTALPGWDRHARLLLRRAGHAHRVPAVHVLPRLRRHSGRRVQRGAAGPLARPGDPHGPTARVGDGADQGGRDRESREGGRGGSAPRDGPDPQAGPQGCAPQARRIRAALTTSSCARRSSCTRGTRASRAWRTW